MRDVAHSAASPDPAPYVVAEAVFAEAKAYLFIARSPADD